jgi:hypothetical protein
MELVYILVFVVIGVVLKLVYEWSFVKFVKNVWWLIKEMGLKDVDNWG